MAMPLARLQAFYHLGWFQSPVKLLPCRNVLACLAVSGTTMLSLAVAALAFQAPLAPYRSSYAAAVSPVDAQRTCAPQMASNIRALRDRVKSVKNTKKITSAMKLVAAAKVRRAQEAVLRSRPFSETLERILGGLLKRLSTESLDIPLLETREVNKIGARSPVAAHPRCTLANVWCNWRAAGLATEWGGGGAGGQAARSPMLQCRLVNGLMGGGCRGGATRAPLRSRRPS